MIYNRDRNIDFISIPIVEKRLSFSGKEIYVFHIEKHLPDIFVGQPRPRLSKFGFLSAIDNPNGWKTGSPFTLRVNNPVFPAQARTDSCSHVS